MKLKLKTIKKNTLDNYFPVSVTLFFFFYFLSIFYFFYHLSPNTLGITDGIKRNSNNSQNITTKPTKSTNNSKQMGKFN